MDFIHSHKLIIATVAIQLILLPLILFVVKQQQNTVTKATATTTLFFTPSGSSGSPVAKNIGENFSVDVMINPGANLISSVKMQVDYNPTKVKINPTTPYVQNFQAFPVLLTSGGPVISESGTTGKFAVEVAVKPVLSDAIGVESKVLTINFIAVSPIDQTQISFNRGVNNEGYPTTMITSVAGTDIDPTENVLSSAPPAFIKVNAAPTNSPVPTTEPTSTPTPTTRPTSTPVPTTEPTSTPTPTTRPTSIPTQTPNVNTPTPTTPISSATKFIFSNLKLHGIGRGGDNANPNSTGNLNPLRTTRTFTVDLENAAGTIVKTATGNITYTGRENGVFAGTITLPNTNGLIAGAPYSVKVKTPFYVRTKTSGFITFSPGQSYTINDAVLTAGDTDGDGDLEIGDDYNLIMDCYSDLAAPKNCDANKKLAADISDDGKVNQNDYNLFIRELSVQRGD